MDTSACLTSESAYFQRGNFFLKKEAFGFSLCHFEKMHSGIFSLEPSSEKHGIMTLLTPTESKDTSRGFGRTGSYVAIS